jgi:hypothetical protein
MHGKPKVIDVDAARELAAARWLRVDEFFDRFGVDALLRTSLEQFRMFPCKEEKEFAPGILQLRQRSFGQVGPRTAVVEHICSRPECRLPQGLVASRPFRVAGI